MIWFLVGISCVGKTTIGKNLAEKIGFSFFDLDIEVENYYGKPIERIQDECLSMNKYRKKASMVLDYLFAKNINSVISGTPSGLKYSYLHVYKKHKANKDLYSIQINDSPENILGRLTFYDKDSNPIIEELTDSKKRRFLKGINADYNYFRDSYKRADFKIDINNISLSDIPDLIIKELQKTLKIPAAQT